MARQDDIEDFLRRFAPVCLRVATHAQSATTQLGASEWMHKTLPRTASANQVIGTARWRTAGDTLVGMPDLPAGVEVSTTDQEHNQGRYYLRVPALGLLITIRREPHDPEEQPKVLQMQMETLIEQCPVAYDDEVVVYLSVPPKGHAPTFEVATRGEEPITYRLADLIEDEDATKEQPPISVLPPPQTPPPGPTVRSSLDHAEERDGSDSSSG